MTCCWLCGFQTTELATKPEAPTCKNGPCQICTAVTNLDEEINQAAATLRRLLVKRCDLRSEQNRVHGTLIHRLPAELTNDIFELLLPLRDEWGAFPPFGRPSTVTPLYLASICRSWRDIAWSNPFLWSTIHIAVEALTPDVSSRIKFVHDWILRSQTLPLTLHIDACLASDSAALEEELKGVIDAITQCSHRWHSLFLSMPLELLHVFHLTDFQCRLLRRFQIDAISLMLDDTIRLHTPLLNPTASPEKIYLHRVSFQSLQISWNLLASATVTHFDLEEITQLFQHASQMTYCHLVSPRRGALNFSMPPITNQILKTLGLSHPVGLDVAPMFLRSLTLPCLEEFHTSEMGLLTPAYLPALVHRSSSPLSRIKIHSQHSENALGVDDLQPLPGVSDLVLETIYDPVIYQKILLEEYFPNLRHLTLRIHPFLHLWSMGVIPLLLDRIRPRPDAPKEGRLCKLLVYDEEFPLEFDDLWNSDIGEQLKALNISLMEDGFEFL